MLFTLTYDGPLPTRGRGTAAEKQRIREYFHPQLAELWRHEPLAHQPDLLKPKGEDNVLSALITVGQHTYAALVTRQLHLRAELDVLMLRPQAAGAVISGGDIDNRLKILFDALRCPRGEQEIKADAMESSTKDPVHALLEDDDLVTRVHVDTDRLLDAPGPDHIRLVVRVRVRASRLIYGNMALVS